MDLTTSYMGLTLKNPLIASASTLTGEMDNIKLLEDSGAAALVLPSLFQEEIEAEAERYHSLTSAHNDCWPEATSNFPLLVDYQQGPHQYLDLIRQATQVVDIPIIASLNGVTNEGWIGYAKSIQEAGADGLELNVYFIATDLALSGQEVELRYLDILHSVRAAVSIPVAVKLSPHFSALGHLALRLQDGGADAIVLFNRFYQPDFDTVSLRVVNDLRLSDSHETRLPLLWIAVLAGRVKASLAASTGVASAEDVIKYLLAGADVVMTTSALLRHGPRYMGSLLAGLESWLTAREFTSLKQVRGIMSQGSLNNPQALERVHYMKILQDYHQG